HAVDVLTPTVAPTDLSRLARFLRSTRLIPTDGIVKATAAEITRGAGSDIEKARAIYEWIVDNTFRDPKTRGCGLGDIRFMLETKSFGGKCADINGLFVGLARAPGIPAPDGGQRGSRVVVGEGPGQDAAGGREGGPGPDEGGCDGRDVVAET